MSKARWLHEDEQRTWLSLVLMMTGLDAALDQQLQRDSGISYRDLHDPRRAVGIP